MFQILSVFAASVVGALPVEVWAGILRFLGPTSLLSCVRSSNFFRSVCRGDPNLRIELRHASKEERGLVKKIREGSGSLVTITRRTPSEMFKANVNKQVDSTKYVSAYRQVQHILVPQKFDKDEPIMKWYVPGAKIGGTKQKKRVTKEVSSDGGNPNKNRRFSQLRC